MSTNKKITQLDELTPATWADDDVIAIVDISAQETKKIQLSTFRTAVGGVTTLTATTPLTVDTSLGDVTISVAISGGGTVNAVLDEDNMASNSPTALSTQQSIKAYVDSQIITVDSLSEVLALGNTTGGTDLSVSTGDDITFPDNSKAIFGTGSDLQIYHNGTNSVIGDFGTGDLLIYGTDDVFIRGNTTSNYMARFAEEGAVTLYYDNAIKLATTATGVDVTGTIVGDGLTLTTGATVTTVLDEDNMASNSATALATQQSIKAYVDAEVGTADTLSEVLALGNTTGGTNIVVSSGDVITTNTINETTAASGVTIDSLLVKDGGITAAGTSTFAGQTITDLGAVTTADINGGTIDGTVIGGSSAAAGTFTTFTSTGIDDNATSTAITIDSSENVGIGTSAPGSNLHVQGDAGSNVNFYLTDGDATGVGNSLLIGKSGNVSYIYDRKASSNLWFGTADAERMRIDSSGNVGIGTSIPTEKLEVTGNLILDATDANIKLKSGVTGTNGAVNWTFNTDSTVYSSISLTYDTRATIGLKLDSVTYPITLDSGDGIRFQEDGSETVRISSAGYVGIGTASPGYELDVAAVSDPAIRVRATGASTGDDSFIRMAVSNATSSNYIQFGDNSDSDVGYIRYAHSNDSLIIVVNAATRMIINSRGSLLVGQSSSASPGFNNTTAGGAWSADGTSLHLSRSSNGCAWFNRSTTTGSVQSFRYNGTGVGTISVTASATAYNTSSDYRLKENVVPLNGAIDRVKLLNPSRFNFIVDPDTTVDGFVAHEVSDVVPEAICGEKDAVDAEGNPEYQGIDQSKLVPLLTAALKEALTKIDSLETRITALEG